MNNSKSGIMVIKGRLSRSKEQKYIEDIPIVHHYKYLGITMSESLRIELHVDKLHTRMNGFRYFMSQLKPKEVSTKTRLELWKTFFRCHIQYAADSALADDTSMDKLKRMYMMSLKQAMHLPVSTSTVKLLYFTGTWSHESLFLYKLCLTHQQ